MKKLKKYIYPFVFSLLFFVTYIILAVVLNKVLPYGDYAGLAYAFIALLIWIFVITPIYCVRYGRIIRNEKFKFLFAAYNPFVIVLCHTGPFFYRAGPSSIRVIVSIAVALLGWAAFWTVVPFLGKADSAQKQNKDSNET